MLKNPQGLKNIAAGASPIELKKGMVKGLDFVGKSDELFSFVAMQHATPIVSVAFIIGLVAAAYSSADSALTALTTSFCVDFLGYERSKPTDIKKRRWVHIGFAFILFITISNISP